MKKVIFMLILCLFATKAVSHENIDNLFTSINEVSDYEANRIYEELAIEEEELFLIEFRKQRQLYFLSEAIGAAKKGENYFSFTTDSTCIKDTRVTLSVPIYRINHVLAIDALYTLGLEGLIEDVEVAAGLSLLQEAEKHAPTWLERRGSAIIDTLASLLSGEVRCPGDSAKRRTNYPLIQ